MSFCQIGYDARSGRKFHWKFDRFCADVWIVVIQQFATPTDLQTAFNFKVVAMDLEQITIYLTISSLGN